MPKVSLILGISGQDGCYLARLLLAKGHKVVGVARGQYANGLTGLTRLRIHDKVSLNLFDAEQPDKLEMCIRDAAPIEIYNLAGPSSVAESFANPSKTIRSAVNITVNCLEAIRNNCPGTKYYNSASSECFGDTGNSSASETTPFDPISPYGIAKSACYHLTRLYRKNYGIFSCSGILFNHESPIRPINFVTQKIVAAAKAISKGEQDVLELGDLDVERDWGWAPDHVDAIYRILQHTQPDDFVISTGQSRSLREVVRLAFTEVGLNWENHVDTSEDLLRPAEIKKSRGTSRKAELELGWSPTKGLEEIISAMMND